MIGKIVTSGKRKRAVAKASITEGNGIVTFNHLPLKQLEIFKRLRLEEPIRIAQVILGKLTFNASIRVMGGGERGQVEAARLALAKGIVAFSGSDDLKKAYAKYDRTLLVADVRRKEPYKPGDSKARSKRQKSYR